MLSVDNLYVDYGGIQALKGISLEVCQNEIVSVLGANGAGKSTLLMSISGIVDASKGNIVFEGEKISGKSSCQIVRAGISQVPEGREVFKRLSVQDNLMMGTYHHHRKSSKQSIASDLERVFDYFPRLQERRSQLAGTLSGGEQQMLAIGRGIMARPKLLMLDEPSLGLAPLIIEDIFKIILELHRENIPILLIEQNAKAALKIATRGYVMEAGRIILEGKASDLLENKEVVSAYLGG